MNTFMKKLIILCVVLAVFTFFCLASIAQESKPMTVRVGDSFTITLRANTSTGYKWQLMMSDENMLQMVHSEYIPYKSQRLGADGKQLWTFKALKPGKTSISFQYARSWEKDKPPQKEQTIQVLIK